MSFKTLPYRIVYGKPCHLPIKLEHRAWWAIRTFKYDLITAGEERRLHLSGLELRHMRVLDYLKRGRS